MQLHDSGASKHQYLWLSSEYLAGTSITNIKPHTINLVGETDSLEPNANNYADFASGFGAAYRNVELTNQTVLLGLTYAF